MAIRFQDVANAVHVLHSSAASGGDRKAADDWLTSVQRSTNAWEVEMSSCCYSKLEVRSVSEAVCAYNVQVCTDMLCQGHVQQEVAVSVAQMLARKVCSSLVFIVLPRCTQPLHACCGH